MQLRAPGEVEPMVLMEFVVVADVKADLRSELIATTPLHRERLFDGLDRDYACYEQNETTSWRFSHMENWLTAILGSYST